MDASEYLESQLGQTIENIKEEYISGKRLFFLKTKDMDLVRDIIERGSILPYMREVKSFGENGGVIEQYSNVKIENLGKLNVSGDVPNVFVWSDLSDDLDKYQNIPWNKLFQCVKRYTKITDISKDSSSVNNQTADKLFCDSIILIVCGKSVRIPGELEAFSAIIHVPSISSGEFARIAIRQIKELEGVSVPQDDEFINNQLYHSMRGMSKRQIINALTECKVKVGKIYDLSEEHRQRVLKLVRTSAERILESVDSLTIVGSSNQSPSGMCKLNEWLDRNRAFVSDISECKKFAQPAPKGILVSGLPGSGKSMMAKYVANKFNLGLIRFDIGDVGGKYVGDSEKNMNEALSVIETLSPCVLWIDEIEKGFSGASSNDGHETSKRIFGKFLTWMQEKSENGSSCFVFATANDISKMPPELFRSGRFDEKFYMFFPSAKECGMIFDSQIKYQCKQRKELDRGNEEARPLFNTSRINEGLFTKLLDSEVCLPTPLDSNQKDFIRTNKFFTGSDIEQLIIKAKVDYINAKNRKYDDGDKDAEFDSIGFEECLKEAIKKMRTYGETNIDDVAVNFAKLVRNNFSPASNTIIVPFEGFNYKALYNNSNEDLYVLHDENKHIFSLTSQYDCQLYLNIRNAINALKHRIQKEIDR